MSTGVVIGVPLPASEEQQQQQHERGIKAPAPLPPAGQQADAGDSCWSSATLWALFCAGWIFPPCWWLGVAAGLTQGVDDQSCLVRRRQGLSSAQAAAWWACTAMSILSSVAAVLMCSMYYSRQTSMQNGSTWLPRVSELRESGQRYSPVGLATQGRHIINTTTGARVKLRCASWSGAQEKWFVPSGLWAQHRSEIAQQARLAGLNCIRLVWSVEAVLGPNSRVPAEAVAANPDLVGRSPLAVLDAVIEALADQGLMVILDNTSSDAMWCCSEQDENGLWYNTRWSEEQWLLAWSTVARHYAHTSSVVGVGLRNEPRTSQQPWGQGLLYTAGIPIAATVPMSPTWGTGSITTDLAIAYEKAAAEVLAARPTYLVFAQGLMWGRDLTGVRERPLLLRTRWPDGPVVSNRLAYEVHEYPWFWHNDEYSHYEKFAAALDNAWGFVVLDNIAPVWVSEFGVEHTPEGLHSPWFQSFTGYLKERDLDWSYWPLDGQMGPSRNKGEEEYYGLLNTSWNGPSYPELLQHLHS